MWILTQISNNYIVDLVVLFIVWSNLFHWPAGCIITIIRQRRVACPLESHQQYQANHKKPGTTNNSILDKFNVYKSVSQSLTEIFTYWYTIITSKRFISSRCRGDKQTHHIQTKFYSNLHFIPVYIIWTYVYYCLHWTP